MRLRAAPLRRPEYLVSAALDSCRDGGSHVAGMNNPCSFFRHAATPSIFFRSSVNGMLESRARRVFAMLARADAACVSRRLHAQAIWDPLGMTWLLARTRRQRLAYSRTYKDRHPPMPVLGGETAPLPPVLSTSSRDSHRSSMGGWGNQEPLSGRTSITNP